MRSASWKIALTLSKMSRARASSCPRITANINMPNKSVISETLNKDTATAFKLSATRNCFCDDLGAKPLCKPEADCGVARAHA